jgi:hypothetical protein
MKTRLSRLAAIIPFCVLAIAVMGCEENGAGDVSSASPTAPTPTAGQRFVTVGFWQNETCTGDMIGTTAFPVDFGDTGVLHMDRTVWDELGEPVLLRVR